MEGLASSGSDPTRGGVEGSEHDRRGVAELFGRTDPASAAKAIAATLRHELPGYANLDESLLGEQIVELARPIAASFSNFVVSGGHLRDEELELIREAARARVREGVPLNDILRAYRIGTRIGWQLLASEATPEEQPLLPLGGELLMDFLDRLSTAEAEAYLEEENRVKTETEHQVRLLIEGIAKDVPLDAGLVALAERIGFPLEESEYRPFALALLGSSAREHSKAAAELRTRRVLAVTEQRSIFGVLAPGVILSEEVEESHVVALGEATGSEWLSEALDEARLLLTLALQRGLVGEVRVDAFHFELLLARSPHLAEQLRQSALAPLEQAPSPSGDLLRTLETYLGRRLDRRAVAAELQIHPNTLDHRLRRVEELTGLDLKRPTDLGMAAVAVKYRRMVPLPPRGNSTA